MVGASADNLSFDSGIDMAEAQVMVEPVMHTETDSIQGTLTLPQAGYYVLRWQLALDPTGPQASFSDWLWPKATVMYHYEVIPHTRFR